MSQIYKDLRARNDGTMGVSQHHIVFLVGQICSSYQSRGTSEIIHNRWRKLRHKHSCRYYKVRKGTSTVSISLTRHRFGIPAQIDNERLEKLDESVKALHTELADGRVIYRECNRSYTSDRYNRSLFLKV